MSDQTPLTPTTIDAIWTGAPAFCDDCVGEMKPFLWRFEDDKNPQNHTRPSTRCDKCGRRFVDLMEKRK